MTTAYDPRETLQRTVDTASAVLAGMKPEQAADPTPCTEFDVATLTNHLIGATDRISTIAQGVQIEGGLENSSQEPAEGWTGAFDKAGKAAIEAWQDDALLGKEFVLPWATVPGAAIVEMYSMEIALHTWDLAVSTGQDHLLDDEVAAQLMPAAQRFLPPEHRGGEIPFAPVVELPADARAADRLAAFTGRLRP